MIYEKKRSIPWFTIFIALICTGMYSAFLYFKWNNIQDHVLYSNLGAPSSIEIYQGKFWGVFLNSFVHSQLPLFLLSITGIFILGNFIERKTGFLTLFILGFLASTLTSLIQLGLSGDAGIGMTGANFFFASYIYARSIKDESFRMNYRGLVMLIAAFILISSLITNYYFDTNFGIESMASGLILGSFIGFFVGARYKFASYSFVLITFGLLSTSLFYSPWSVKWNLSQAYAAHEINDYQKAKYYYHEVKNITKQDGIADHNLLLIEIDELSEEAFETHKKGNYIKAHSIYNKILNLDHNNQWAKDQINKLP